MPPSEHHERNDDIYQTIASKETVPSVESPVKVVKKGGIGGMDPNFVVMNPNSVKKANLALYLQNKKKARKFGEQVR